jgi:hypothetical protein
MRGSARVAVAAAALAAGLGATIWALRSMDPAPADPGGAPQVPEEPPPDFPRPPVEDERLRRALELLLTGDPDTAAWARDLLAAGGEPARKLVAEMARHMLVSNRAFAEQAFDILLRDPRREDVPLAAAALDNPDPEVVRRACILLGRAGGPLAREQMPRIASVVAAGWPLSNFAMQALVDLGGDEAVAQLERISQGAEFVPAERDAALPRIGRVGGEKARAILSREFRDAKTDDRRRAAAEGLVAMRDPSPLPYLREQWEKQRDERALALLARAGDDVAFAELESRLRAPIETEERRLQALTFLEPYPAARRREILRLAGAAPSPREVRVEAWTQLWNAGDTTDREDLLRMLRAEGADAREGTMVAALVLGRLRDPVHTKALLVALATEGPNRSDRELRVALLRAVILSGDPEGAETVVRAMAEDQSPYGSKESVAFELSVMFGQSTRPFLNAAAPHLRAALENRLGAPGQMARIELLQIGARACGADLAPVVEPLLTDPDPKLREAAAVAIVDAAGPRSVAALKAAWWKLRDPADRAALRRALERVVLAPPVK